MRGLHIRRPVRIEALQGIPVPVGRSEDYGVRPDSVGDVLRRSCLVAVVDLIIIQGMEWAVLADGRGHPSSSRPGPSDNRVTLKCDQQYILLMLLAAYGSHRDESQRNRVLHLRLPL